MKMMMTLAALAAIVGMNSAALASDAPAATAPAQTTAGASTTENKAVAPAAGDQKVAKRHARKKSK